ncbi:HBS1-like protein [Penicillium atrosanguineum]|uniref:Uncharacterized protein n=1 Tax=Penicillium atrosanguineum TaxID=1132637 RepID=A0A9W9U162_9EURO|nr:HBS1-like protein [Penicillium atrosanguineum]KAJ5293024.1 HBS1-like protein [Penicillium atrosanguineum]KAJ5302939.1 hypothetical protein N7476_009738 [Penicillium atrosanguineum]
MAPLGQTIAVIDKSGKVVSTSKQLFGVFSQAKAAYKERKSHFDAERNAKLAEEQALQALAHYKIDDSKSVGSRRSHRSKSQHHATRSVHRGRASSRYEQDLQSASGRESRYAPSGISRRHTHHEIAVREPEGRPLTARSKSDAHIDMDLAYGEAHPAALSRYSPPGPNDQNQLDGLVNKAQWLLEEAHCVQHSATATISHLQKNPDAMAAVALTLAEISTLASKMAPAALSALKSASPAVFALLSSPQFLIAAGVGLGVTVIIKKIQGETASGGKQEESIGMDDMMELNVEQLSHVEMWRRGVADIEARSVGTSVDGEFITPKAAAMSGIDVTTARLERDPRFKFDDESVASSRHSGRSRTSRHTRARSAGRSRADYDTTSRAPSGFFSRPSKAPPRASSQAPSRAPSKVPSKAPSKAPSRAPSKSGSFVPEKEKRPREKKKKGPSRLRLMFTA